MLKVQTESLNQEIDKTVTKKKKETNDKHSSHNTTLKTKDRVTRNLQKLIQVFRKGKHPLFY